MAELHPAVLMFVAQRHVEQRVMAAVVAAGFDDLTLPQGRVAARIGEEGTRLTELAEQAQITKQSAGFLIDQLEKAGTSSACPTRPTPGPGWSGWPSAGGPSSPSPAARSRRCSRSGPVTSAPIGWPPWPTR